MNEAIKCCPFCGSQEVHFCRSNPDACWIKCASCDAETDSDTDRNGAIEKWNRRDYKNVFATIVNDDDRAV